MIIRFSTRNLHRKIAYFYVGLIISFAISGLAQNHRNSWNPRKYVVSTKEIAVTIPPNKKELNEKFMKNLANKWKLGKDYEQFRMKGNKARIYFKNAIAEFSIKSGNGELEFIQKRPLLGDMGMLHKSTNSFWTWYSDIFALSLMFIAISGTFIAKGKESFRKSGWKITLIGLLFPLLFLLFLS